MKKIAPPASPFTVSVSRFALFPLVLLNAAAQNAPVSQSTDPAPAPTTAWTLKDIGPNSKTWIAPSPPASMLGAQSNPLYPGQSAPPSRFPEQKVTAIATGMNFWDAAQQQWSSSDSTFDIAPDAFVANRVQHKIRLAADLNVQGAVTLTTRDGIALSSGPVGIGLYNATNGEFLLIASVTNCSGVLISSNSVFYDHAFSGPGVCASVTYILEKGSFRQDVTITGKLDPALWGFPTNSATRIQVISEFYGVPTPEHITRPIYVERRQAVRNNMVTPDFVDSTLGWGEFVLGTGRAFPSSGAVSRSGSGPIVAKEFIRTDDQRQFLVESVRYGSVRKALLSLPDCGGDTGSARLIRKSTKAATAYASHRPSDGRGIKREGYATIPSPPRTALKKVAPARAVAQLAAAGPLALATPTGAGPRVRAAGLIIDYVGTIGGTLNDPQVFRGDGTYLVAGNVTCNGPVTICGGVCFKYPSGASLTLNNTLTCKTRPYSPAIFTCVDDDSTGTSMNGYDGSGYTGTIDPSGYANPAISTWGGSLTLNNFRFCYAQQAVALFCGDGDSPTISHSQFLNCIQGISTTGEYTGCGYSGPMISVNVNNCLMAGVQYAGFFDSQVDNSDWSWNWANCTVANSSQFLFINGTGPVAPANACFNSIFANVADTSGAWGQYNGFYNSPSFGDNAITTSVWPFQTVGAGSFYLRDGSIFRDAGTTNYIDPALLGDLKKTTTYPPIVLSNVTISAATVFSPQAQRDTGVPDLGWHADPIDFCFGGVSATANLTFNPGTAAAWFELPGNGGPGYGIALANGVTNAFNGTATAPCIFTRYDTVQEGGDGLWTDKGWLAGIASFNSDSSRTPQVTANFARFAELASDPNNFRDYWNPITVHANNCEFWSGQDGGYAIQFYFTNCLLNDFNMGLTCTCCATIAMRNCTMHGGSLSSDHSGVGTWPVWIENSAFDGTSFSMDNPSGGNTNITYCNFNAFLTNSPRLPILGTRDVLVTNFNWQTGPLGDRYLPANSPLIDAGSTTADRVNLCHFTTQTSQATEDDSQVDIGGHYAALDADGHPLDYHCRCVAQLPVVSAGSGQTITLPAVANLSGTVTVVGSGPPPCGLTVTWSKAAGPGRVVFGDPGSAETTAAFTVGGTYFLRLSATDRAGTSSDTVQVTVNLPSLPTDLSTVAPPLSDTAATPMSDSTSFLYSGGNPVQFGVASGAIQPLRAAVVRGSVQSPTGTALAGVTVSVLNHPEFGIGFTRSDGAFDLALNGGGQVTLIFEKDGYLPVHRQLDVSWQDYTVAQMVIMSPYDSQMTTVDLAETATPHAARGSVSTDADGSRQATVFFPAGTTASLKMPDGSALPLSSLSFRATEYTVGPNGPNAMPADLPPASGYTYCVELGADEALAADAQSVEFNQPVYHYVENFVGFPVGTPVPVGYYGRQKGQWIPSPDGRVVAILSVSGGLANLDVDGSGTPASPSALATLGITTAERQQLAALYAPGQSRWRTPISHLTPWDCNWPYGVPTDATAPNQPDPTTDDPKKDPCEGEGSIIELQNQILRQSVGVVGTPFTLNYSSDRVPGRTIARTINISVSGASFPASLKRIEVQLQVAGRLYSQTFTPGANLSTVFTWDGRDSYGRVAHGHQPASVRVGYVYPAVYHSPNSFFANFGFPGSVAIDGSKERFEATLWQQWQKSLEWDSFGTGLGGWSLSAHHDYDPIGHVIHFGDGTRRSAFSVSDVILPFAGSHNQGFSGDGGLATQAKLDGPSGLAAAPDGSLYICDGGNSRIRRVTPDGIISTVAGSGSLESSGDGGPALAAGIGVPGDVALGPDGSYYILDVNSYYVRRVTPDGIIHTAAGNGTYDDTGDGGPATQAGLGIAESMAVGPDGSLYIGALDYGVRRVGPDGIINTVAQAGDPERMAIGRDGSLFIADLDAKKVLRLGTDGVLRTFAGNGSVNPLGDGGPATQAGMWPDAVAVGPGGTIYIADGWSGRLRVVGADGIIRTFAGDGGFPLTDAGDGGFAPAAELPFVFGWYDAVAVGPDGSVSVAAGNDGDIGRVRRILPITPGFSGSQFVIASEDGSELYVFDPGGRHLETLNALNGVVLYTFGYDPAGRPIAITDMNNNVTTIQRDANGVPTSIVGPYGATTTLLPPDPNGYLSGIENPANETVYFTYSSLGLMQTMTDPRSHTHNFTFDTLGRLTDDYDPLTAHTHLDRTDLADGDVITATSAMNRDSSYRTENLPTGDQSRVNTGTDTGATTVNIGANGVTTVNSPDGIVTALTEGPEPRWGMQAPLPARIETSMGGHTRVIETTRSVNLLTVGDPLSLLNQTDVIKINGRPYTTLYDATTRAFTTTSPAGRHSSTLLDTKGRVIQSQIPGIEPVSLSYDVPHGRLSALAQGNRSAGITYNGDGYIDTITGPINRSVTFDYDLAGRANQTTLRGNRTIRFAHDLNGNLTTITPPGRPDHDFAFNAGDLVSDYLPPLVSGTGANETQFVYNDDEQLRQALRPDNLTITLDYDTAGRLHIVTTPRGQTTIAYNGLPCGCSGFGKPSSITAPDNGVLSYVYAGNLLMSSTWAGTVAGSVGRTYDDDFRLSTISVNGQNPIAYGYDPDSLLTQAGSLTLVPDPDNGLLTGTTIGNMSDTIKYNEFAEATNYVASFNGTALFTDSLGRDDLGRITNKTETIAGVATAYGFDYDTSGHLSDVSVNGALVSHYDFGANDNRYALTQSGQVTSYTTDDQDRLLQVSRTATLLPINYTYTAAGELFTRTIGSDTASYNYDILGGLLSVTLPDGTVVAYVLDGLNRRIGKKVNGTLVQGFLYQDGLKIIAELDGSGNVVSRFVYAGAPNVPAYMIKAGVTYRIITDHLGSPRLVVNVATGAVAQRMDYDEFGKVTLDTNPGFQPFGFAGGLYDSQTRLVRFGTRDYDAEVGRWLSRDPMGEWGGINLYQFNFNNPLSYIDTTGEAPQLTSITYNPSTGQSSAQYEPHQFGQGYGIHSPPSDPFGALNQAWNNLWDRITPPINPNTDPYWYAANQTAR